MTKGACIGICRQVGIEFKNYIIESTLIDQLPVLSICLEGIPHACPGIGIQGLSPSRAGNIQIIMERLDLELLDDRFVFLPQKSSRQLDMGISLGKSIPLPGNLPFPCDQRGRFVQ